MKKAALDPEIKANTITNMGGINLLYEFFDVII
jgi:hypothetical protein